MSRNSPFLAADRPMGSSRSSSSYRNDDNCYVDDNLVKKLQRKRNSVMQLMTKAEEKQWKTQLWLVDIKHALYDANALLDKIDTEARFREKYKEDGSPSYSISEFVQWATSEINRIIEELEGMVKEAGDMDLKARDEGAAASAQQTRIPNDRVTSPVLGKSTIVYGREEEKARILKQVLYSPESATRENKPEVISIVGMDGIGKTTLAQYVERCFMRSWACVFHNFDIVRVTRAILEYLTGKARILKKMLYSPEPAAPGIKPEVIAIVGMGGLGKTTLAQYVYNHADVERSFTRSWACVSDNFDLSRVTQAILESLTGTAAGVRDLAPLQQQLQEQLTGKRFLLVLDDAWDSSEQNWEKLMAPFSTGAIGSKIILTTRDTRVAGVAPADHSFQLEPMSEDEAWSMFSCEVLRDGELSQHPKLEAIGKEIVKKCGGSPLAIKTLSGLLRSERKEVEWERVRASSLWQLPEGQKDIAPALGLSYSYLPSHLKTCFAYCSLFPKGYRFSKEELVNLWVDEGFLQQPNDNRSIEDVGVAFFEDLSSRSFFTQSYGDKHVMHDLIHDLAQMVFTAFHQQLNGHKAVKECKKVRHISFHDTSECDSSSKFEGLNQAESLQTFMVQYEPKAPRWGLDDRILEDVLLQQLSLRVLCLRGARIRTLPDTISSLMLLRCLDVSYTDVEELPASLCKLYNLRRLLCESCDQIKEFHYDMAAFVSLQHFTLSGRQLQKAPRNLSQLSRVKLEFHLPYSGDDRMNQGDGTDSSDLRDTKEGSVDVDMVDVANVSDSGDEQEGEVDVALDQAESDSNHTESGLHVIVNVISSTFRFDTDGKDAFIASDLLESLRPHTDVKEVCIQKFNGTEFPGWLVDRSYRNIEKIILVKCWISSGLMPALGGLPSLKRLQLEGVRNVKKLGSELYNSTVPFGSLEELCFGYMKEWEEWEPSDDAAAGEVICFFPRLQKLSIVSCPKLKGRLPSNLPSLKELLIQDCSSLVELNGCHCHRQVVDLRVIECGPRVTNSCLVDMRLGMFPYLERLKICLVIRRLGMFPYLERLKRGYCDSFECFPADDYLPTSLTYLEIQGFTRLKKLDVFLLQSLTNLESLVIHDCPLLESLGYSSDVDNCSSDDEFPFNSSLRVLEVRICVRLKTINGAWLRSFTSLEELHVLDCSKFLALPEKGFPRSLTRLYLMGFMNIRRQDWIAIQNLTSLEELAIIYCRELKALPVKLPCSLKKLMLLGSHPDLKERCKRGTGPDWPKIAHVPDISIG